MTDRGIVGTRQLVAVQTFDIARLTTHPVAIRPSTFIAVSGIGPKGDSNGSGKTSFLAAVSILLADPQWRIDTNAGRFASGVLFRPDAAGVDPALKVGAAPYGYIVGIFAGTSYPQNTPVTVWVRIASDAPYLQVRWTNGVHVADAEIDKERFHQADALWRAIPNTNNIQAKHMAELLYGEAPRCLTYLDTSLRPRLPSLLSQQMTEMKPSEIGSSLIALAGLTSKIDEEERQRGEVIDQLRELGVAESSAAAQWNDEEAELGAVTARDAARAALDNATKLWRMYLAKQYLRSLEQDRLLDSQIPERIEIWKDAQDEASKAAKKLTALRALTDLAAQEKQAQSKFKIADEHHRQLLADKTVFTTQKGLVIAERNDLLPKAERWNRTAPHDAKRLLDEATLKRVEADSALDAAEKGVVEAEHRLEMALAGRGGDAGVIAERLNDLGITATVLMDTLSVDDTSRHEWEPILWSWRDAVIITPQDHASAMDALEDDPGVQLVLGQHADTHLSIDGLHYPIGLHGFVTTARARLQFAPLPPRAHDNSLGVTTLGGFTEPFIGRQALVQHARARHHDALELLQGAERQKVTAQASWTLADIELTAANAAHRLTYLEQQIKSFDQHLAKLDPAVAAAKETKDEKEKAYHEARDLRVNHDGLVLLQEGLLEKARQHEGASKKKVEDLRAARIALAIEIWRRNWGDDEQEARSLIDGDQSASGARPQTLIRQTSEQLNEALKLFIVSAGDPPEDVHEAALQREKFAEQPWAEPPIIALEAITGPLSDRLARYADRDAITRARIEQARTTRHEALEQLRIETANAAERQRHLQGMIEHHIEGVLRNVSAALNRLSTFGAELELASVRPEGAAGWKWNVIPKWRRSQNGAMVPYQEVANGAQVKVFAIQLVLAALIADVDTQGRVLILDELGNSLGDINRKEVLRSLSSVAEQQEVTILGTCQDSVLPDAADYFGELIWFTHATSSDSYNQPTRVWEHDPNGERVELTAEWLRAGRALV